MGQTEATPDKARLSVRNLLRGYRYRLPTGQAVANLLGVDVLTPDELRAAAGSQAQVDALEAGGFLDRTPLWHYILAEAAHHGGDRMGPVGSTIVAEVLVGLIRHTTDSILRYPGWTPSLPAAGDHFRLARDPRPQPRHRRRPRPHLPRTAADPAGGVKAPR